MTQDRRSPLGRRLATAIFSIPWVQRRWSRRYRALALEGIPWSLLDKPLPHARVALITTGGVHLRTDMPFDMTDSNGDPSYRVIPSASTVEELMITHDYYDHSDADRDLNVVLPIDVLREFGTGGHVGEMAPNFYSLMGHIDGEHLDTLRHQTAPELAERLKAEGVDVAIFTPA